METLRSFQDALQQRFNQLNRKEQYYLMVLALLIVPYLVYVILWQPLANSNTQLLQANIVAQQQLSSVQQLAGQYNQLHSKDSGNNSRVNLPQLINDSVLRHKLSLKRLQPSANGEIQLRFENVLFNNMVAWIYELESEYGVIVKDLSINPGNGVGLVSSSVRLRKG